MERLASMKANSSCTKAKNSADHVKSLRSRAVQEAAAGKALAAGHQKVGALAARETARNFQRRAALNDARCGVCGFFSRFWD